MNPVVDAKNKLFTTQKASPCYIFPREKYKTPAGSSEGGGGAAGNKSPATDTDPGSDQESTTGSGKNRQPSEMILRHTGWSVAAQAKPGLHPQYPRRGGRATARCCNGQLHGR